MTGPLTNLQAAAIFGYPLEWDVCPGCGRTFPARYGNYEEHQCDDCSTPWREEFDRLPVPPAPLPAPSDEGRDGSTLSQTVQRIASNSTTTTRKVQP